MQPLQIRLFGRFAIARDGDAPVALESSRAQELLSYLLLHRGQRCQRETLAGVLFADQPSARSRQYLRKTLWQLQGAFACGAGADGAHVFDVDTDSVAMADGPGVWLDVESFEAACARARGVPGRRLEPEMAESLRRAVELYRGELLEGYYQDWCLVERERLHLMYLSALDKLISYSEAHGEYEAGLDYGHAVLRYDRAREYTHRALMRLEFLAGDRTGALRQYERCRAALREELGVAPAPQTTALYERIRAGGDAESGAAATQAEPGLVGRLRQLQGVLQGVQRQVAREIEALEESHRRA